MPARSEDRIERRFSLPRRRSRRARRTKETVRAQRGRQLSIAVEERKDPELLCILSQHFKKRLRSLQINLETAVQLIHKPASNLFLVHLFEGLVGFDGYYFSYSCDRSLGFPFGPRIVNERMQKHPIGVSFRSSPKNVLALS